MSVFFSVAILLLYVLSVQIRVGVHFYLDLFGNDGFLKVYVFGIRVFAATVRLEHDGSKQNNLLVLHGKKEDKIHLNTDPEDKRSVAGMMKNPLFGNILAEKLSAHFIVGKTNDAFFTMALTQTLRVLFYAALSPVKCRYSVGITESFVPVCNRDVLQADVIGIIGTSIANSIISAVGSLAKKKPTSRKQEVAKA